MEEDPNKDKPDHEKLVEKACVENEHGWIDIKKLKPKIRIRVLICDANGYVCIKDTSPVVTGHFGTMSWLQYLKFNYEEKIVAWQPLPKWPEKFCRENADGEYY